MDELSKNVACCGRLPVAALAACVCENAAPTIASIKFLSVCIPDREPGDTTPVLLEARIILVYSTGSESIVNAVIHPEAIEDGEETMLRLQWMDNSLVIDRQVLADSSASFVGVLAELVHTPNFAERMKQQLRQANAILAATNAAREIAQCYAKPEPPRRDRDHKQEYYRRRFHGRQCGRR